VNVLHKRGDKRGQEKREGETREKLSPHTREFKMDMLISLGQHLER